jgi:hypothetical protein
MNFKKCHKMVSSDEKQSMCRINSEYENSWRSRLEGNA